jgi:hypothetical protein
VSGTWHPDGCRCSGCRQPVARTPRPAAPRPVYRNAPRSHAWNCPCSRCAQVRARNRGNAGIIGPGLLIVGVVAVVGFWPAMVWHGEGGPSGTAWQWNIDSTIGCCIWWGSWVLLALIIWACRKYGSPPPPVRAHGTAPVLPAPCPHLGRVRVESVLDEDETVAWWCPDCEKTLDPGFKPPAPAADPAPATITPAGGYNWRWWCTCGRTRSGVAATEAAMLAAVRRCTTGHQWAGHRWQYEWKGVG